MTLGVEGATRETFGSSYVQQLRRQSANYRVRVRELEAEVEKLQKSKDRMAARLARALETNKKLIQEA